jgi:phospholipase C
MWRREARAEAAPQAEARDQPFGLGVRVPLSVVSPHARRGVRTSSKPADHTSTLKFVERVFGLPTLASRDHTFDTATPTEPNYDTGGGPSPAQAPLCVNHLPPAPSWKTTVFSPVSSTTSK